MEPASMNATPAFATWLYGSHARGDADELSDIDMLVISESVDDPIDVSDLYPERSASVTRYTWAELEGMVESGSLFLLHLELEGRPLTESPSVKGRLAAALSRLGRYKFAARDAQGFSDVLSDVRHSLWDGGSLVYELATLGTVVRHTAILGCAMAGQPCFSRYEPVRRVSELWGTKGRWESDFDLLYRYRLYADGRLSKPPSATLEFATHWCNLAEELICELQRRLCEPH
jgi:predicted nucleotidyltransferase